MREIIDLQSRLISISSASARERMDRIRSGLILTEVSIIMGASPLQYAAGRRIIGLFQADAVREPERVEEDEDACDDPEHKRAGMLAVNKSNDQPR